MDRELRGSDLARAMLKSGYRNIWCAVDDESDEQAMMDNDGHDFTAYIVEFENGYFHSEGGMQWLYAVPIKIEEMNNDCCACGLHRDQLIIEKRGKHLEI